MRNRPMSHPTLTPSEYIMDGLFQPSQTAAVVTFQNLHLPVVLISAVYANKNSFAFTSIEAIT